MGGAGDSEGNYDLSEAEGREAGALGEEGRREGKRGLRGAVAASRSIWVLIFSRRSISLSASTTLPPPSSSFRLPHHPARIHLYQSPFSPYLFSISTYRKCSVKVYVIKAPYPPRRQVNVGPFKRIHHYILSGPGIKKMLSDNENKCQRAKASTCLALLSPFPPPRVLPLPLHFLIR